MAQRKWSTSKGRTPGGRSRKAPFPAIAPGVRVMGGGSYQGMGIPHEARRPLDRWIQRRWQSRVPLQRGLPGRSPYVLYRGLYTQPNSYGHEGRVLLLALLHAGYTVQVVGTPPVAGWGEAFGVDRREARMLEVLHYPGGRKPRVEIAHVAADAYQPMAPGTVRIGRPLFDAEGIPPTWLDACRRLDEIWVPSRFNEASFLEAGLPADKIQVLPIGVDTTLFHPKVTPSKLPELGRCVFVAAFPWEQRSGWPLLLEAYFREFGPDDGVALIIHRLPGPHTSREADNQLQQWMSERRWDPRRMAPVLFDDRPLTPKDRASLFAACHAFVLPTRGEGWGGVFLEAMASGLPVIGTRWGGNLDFMNDDNAYLVDVEKVEDVPDDLEFPSLYARSRLARPSVDHLRHLMRQVVENQDEARDKAQRAREDVEQSWDVKHTCSRLVARLGQWVGRRPRSVSLPTGGVGM